MSRAPTNPTLRVVEEGELEQASLASLQRAFDAHARQDAAELASIRNEQATRSQTFWQTLILAFVSAATLIACALITAYYAGGK